MEDEGVAPKPTDPNNVDVGPGAAPTTSVLLPNGIAVELDVIVVVGANACDSPEEDDPNDNAGVEGGGINGRETKMSEDE